MWFKKMEKLNKIKSFGFLYSRRCFAQCQHCGTSSTPFHRKKLSMNMIEKILKALSQYDIDSVGISGGEPLVYYEDMLEIGDMAQRYNIGLILFSNAFWAKNEEITEHYLSNLKERGLNTLQLSTDQFHQEFIDKKNIVMAANMAERLDIPCTVMIPSPASGWSTIQTLSYLEMECNAELITHPIHPIGRALELDDSYFQWRALTLEGCDLVGRIEVDSTALVAQCPPASDFDESNPLILGDLHHASVEDMMDKYQQRLLYWILGNYGPLGLYYLFLESGVEMSVSVVGKVSNCQLCQQLTSNQQYFKDFTTFEKIDLQSSHSMSLENQEQCRRIIEKSQKKELK